MDQNSLNSRKLVHAKISTLKIVTTLFKIYAKGAESLVRVRTKFEIPSIQDIES